MKKLLVGFAALPFLASAAMAGKPMPLSNAQMDQVTAGLSDNFAIVHFINDGFVIVPPFNTATGTDPPGSCIRECVVLDTDIPRFVIPGPLIRFPTVP
jgi:hypothetical protein